MEHTSRLQALTQQLQGLQETLGALEERARYGSTRKREAEDNLHKLTGELRTMRAGWVGEMIYGWAPTQTGRACGAGRLCC